MADVGFAIKKTPISDEFEITDELGRGSFSVVKLATHRATHKQYAIKIIDKNNADESQVQSVLEEARIVLGLDHPNIVKLFSVHEDEQHYYLLLELITGGELFDKIVQLQCYSEKDASKLVRQIVSALEYLHSKKICHRDLKPENLLLEYDSPYAPIKLADFGLATVVQPNTLLHKAVGTPSYIAPEILQVLEGGPGYDEKADMWSLGVILYILLCGFPPFYAEDDEEIYDQILIGTFAFPEPYWSHISAGAKDLINKLLVLDPAKRLSARQALEHPWLKGEEVPSQHLSTTVEELRKFNARKKLKGAILGVVAMNKLAHGLSGLLSKSRSTKK